MKRSLLVAFFTSALLTWLFYQGEPLMVPFGKTGGSKEVPHPENGRKVVKAASLYDRLLGAGWSHPTTQSVTTTFHRLEPALLANTKVMTEVSGVRQEGKIPLLLQEHPAALGLVLMSYPAAREELAEGVMSTEDSAAQERLLSSCVKYTDRAALSMWARALREHGRLISRLMETHPLWPLDGVFAFDRTQAAGAVGEEYDKWVESAFRGVEPQEEASLLQFLLTAGPGVRERLADEKFRGVFLQRIWPDFVSCVKQAGDERPEETKDGVWHCFANQPAIWTLLMDEPNGRELFQAAGTMAAEMLCGPGSVSKDDLPLRKRMVELLKWNNQEVHVALARFGARDDFRKLVAGRGLDDAHVYDACQQINEAASKDLQKAVSLLSTWSSCTSSELLGHLQPKPEEWKRKLPGFNLLYAAMRVKDGYTLEMSDIGLALKDAAKIYLIVQSAGAAAGLAGVGDVGTLVDVGHASEFVVGLGKFYLQEYVKSGGGLDVVQQAMGGGGNAKGGLPSGTPENQHHILPMEQGEVESSLDKNLQLNVTGRIEAAKLLSRGNRATNKEDAFSFGMAGGNRIYVSLPGDKVGSNPYKAVISETAAKLSPPVAPERTSWQENLGAWWLALAAGEI